MLALLARHPVPGQVKTRLCPPLAPEQAAALYTAMLLDIAAQHADEPAERALWYTPASGRAWFEVHAKAYRLCLQQGESQPDRMAALFRAHAREGRRPIVLRGTDSPTLPQARIDEAFARLEHVDLVLCPDRDGGYNLIGLREPHDALFALQMGHGGVLLDTLARASELGLRAELLEPHHDVDVAADLELLRASLDPRRAPRTAAWLAGRDSPLR